MLSLDGISLVSRNEARAIIRDREPRGLFLEIPESGAFVAIDNSTGEAWAEDFDNLSEAVVYLNDKEE
jgi:hypothetical protein